MRAVVMGSQGLPKDFPQAPLVFLASLGRLGGSWGALGALVAWLPWCLGVLGLRWFLWLRLDILFRAWLVLKQVYPPQQRQL